MARKISTDIPIFDDSGPPQVTEEILQNRYNYLVTQKVVGRMLDAGIITEREYTGIMMLMREQFPQGCPMLSAPLEEKARFDEEHRKYEK